MVETGLPAATNEAIPSLPVVLPDATGKDINAPVLNNWSMWENEQSSKIGGNSVVLLERGNTVSSPPMELGLTNEETADLAAKAGLASFLPSMDVFGDGGSGSTSKGESGINNNMDDDEVEDEVIVFRPNFSLAKTTPVKGEKISSISGTLESSDLFSFYPPNSLLTSSLSAPVFNSKGVSLFGDSTIMGSGTSNGDGLPNMSIYDAASSSLFGARETTDDLFNFDYTGHEDETGVW
jgi:hypothetical protein